MSRGIRDIVRNLSFVTKWRWIASSYARHHFSPIFDIQRQEICALLRKPVKSTKHPKQEFILFLMHRNMSIKTRLASKYSGSRSSISKIAEFAAPRLRFFFGQNISIFYCDGADRFVLECWVADTREYASLRGAQEGHPALLNNIGSLLIQCKRSYLQVA